MRNKTEPADSTGEPIDIHAVLRDERELLGLGEDPMRSHASAICLSGGGIRSATFCLGVLQGLAKLGRLQDFHYLSTVSGGSYIGAWLSTWIARLEIDRDVARADPANSKFPEEMAGSSGIENVSEALAKSVASGTCVEVGFHEPAPIKRLRAYSSFLSPVRGFSTDFISAAAILARNILLNWIVVVPIILAILLLPRVFSALLTANPPPISRVSTEPGFTHGWLWVPPILATFLAVAFASYGVQVTHKLRRSNAPRQLKSHHTNLFFVMPLLFAAFSLVYANRVAPIYPRIDIGQTTDWFGAQCLTILMSALVHAFGSLIGARTRSVKESSRLDNFSTPHADLAWHVVTSAVTGAVAGALIYLTLSRMTAYEVDANAQTSFAVPLVLAALGIASVLRAGLSMRFTGEETREWWGRASALVARAALVWMLLSLLVIQVPEWLLGWVATWPVLTAGVAGAGGVLLAIGTAVIGFWSKSGSDIKQKAKGIGQVIGVHSMELAALASILLIALSASLLLGLLLTRPPFMSNREITAGRANLQASHECQIRVEKEEQRAERQCSEGNADCVSLAPTAKKQSAVEAACTTLPSLSQTLKQATSSENDKPRTEAAQTAISNTTTLSNLFNKSGENNFARLWLFQHQLSMQLSTWPWILILAAALVLTGFLASAVLGANAFSLNAFYGNRLTRAYLGASQKKEDERPDPFTGFDRGDNLSLQMLGPNQAYPGEASTGDPAQAKSRSSRPLLVINTALNLIQPSGDRLEWQERKAASFFMTPRYCGSEVVGFVRTGDYGSTPDGVSVGRAIAISGAAASPSMGYHSSMFVSMLLAFFNVRLGWWMPNPNRPSVREKEEPLIGLGPILREMTSAAGDKTNFVYLSDGGHFENLGLYEMIRRRCKKILVMDMGYDPDYQYEDLENAIRKVRTDFGIEITFDELLRPDAQKGRGGHCCFGRIHYRNDLMDEDEGFGSDQEEDGEIVLVKPILSGDEPVDLLRYAETTRSDGRVFPQQPTSDQFFDEAQFESYRKLGLHSILESFPGRNGGWPKPNPASTSKAAALVKVGSTGDAAPAPRWLPDLAERKGSGLLSMLSSMAPISQAAMLASAITITAAISVSGTVALSNPEVTLKDPGSLTFALGKESEDALAKHLDAYVIGADEKANARYASAIKELKNELQKLTDITHVIKLELNGDPNPAWTEFAQSASTASKSLSASISKLEIASGNLQSAATNINGTTDAFKTSLNLAIKNLNAAAVMLNGTATQLNENVKTVKTGLDGVTTQLGSIEKKVQSISPRQTVRGSGS